MHLHDTRSVDLRQTTNTIIKSRSPECFRLNLAVAKVAVLPVAANVKPNATIFARFWYFIYPVRTYSWPFWATREDLERWSSQKEFHLSKSSAKRWSSSYYRSATMLVRTGQSNTVSQVLGAFGPRGIPVWNTETRSV